LEIVTFKLWHKKYCVLTPNQITVYKDQSSFQDALNNVQGDPSGIIATIALQSCTVTKVDHDKLQFTIEHIDKVRII
jgi:hypothetical protein